MFGLRSPIPENGPHEWQYDAERKRLVNKDFFDYNSNVIYDGQYQTIGLRPDLTNFDQN